MKAHTFSLLASAAIALCAAFLPALALAGSVVGDSPPSGTEPRTPTTSETPRSTSGGTPTRTYQGDENAARPLWDQAFEAYEARRYEDAARLVEQAFQLHQHPLLAYNLGQAQRHLRHYDEALAAYRQYLELCPADEVMNDVYLLMGECLHGLNRRQEANEMFQRYLDLERGGGATTEVQRAIETGETPSEQGRRDPATVQQAQELYNRAQALSEQRQFEQAARLFLEGYQRMPDMHELLFDAGLCFLDAQMLEEGIRALAQYVETPGADPLALYFLGEAYGDQFNFASAVETFERYLQAAPDGEWREEAQAFINDILAPEEGSTRAAPTAEQVQEARTQSARAAEHFEAERYSQALECYQRANELVPSRSLVYDIATTLDAMGRREEAVTHYERFLQGGGDRDILDATAHLEAAECLVELNRLDDARRHVDAFMQRARESNLPDDDWTVEWARDVQSRCESRGGSGGSSTGTVSGETN